MEGIRSFSLILAILAEGGADPANAWCLSPPRGGASGSAWPLVTTVDTVLEVSRGSLLRIESARSALDVDQEQKI